MSLIQWWPLNGDLNNEIDPSNPFINTSTTYSTVANGKLAKCYKCSSNTAGTLRSTKKFNIGKQNSMFCWIYMDSVFGTSSLNAVMGQHRYQYPCGLGLTIKYVSATSGYLSIDTGSTVSGTGSSSTNGGYRTYNNYRGSTLLTTKKWYHIGYTFDNGTLCLYVNGKRETIYVGNTNSGKTEYTDNHLKNMNIFEDYFGAFMWSFANATIGDTGIHGNYIMKGSLNDIRIYDHVLSAYEVEDLYRTKIVHYDFNHYEDVTIKNLLYGKSLSASRLTGATISSSFSNGKLTITTGASSDGKSNSGRLYLPDNLLVSGTAYFVSFKWKLLSGSGTINPSDFCDNSISYKSNSNKGSYYLFQGRGYRATYNSTYRFIDFTGFSPNSSYELWDFQLEEDIEGKTQASDYLAASETGGILTDSSGFHNNKKSGSIYYATDTNIGSYSLASPIVCENKSVGISSFTYNFWIKNKSNTARDITLFSDGKITCGTTAATDYLSTTVTLSDSTTISATSTTQKMSLLTPKFHMITITFDSANLKLYIDGSLHATTTTTLNALSSTTDISLLPNTTNVLISDFKAYACPLTADEILDIYKEAGAVDNKGNLHAEEIIEADETELDDHSPEVLNFNRQSKAESFEEGNDLFEVYKQSTEIENLVYITESTEVSGSFSYDSSYGNVVQFKSSDGTCTITFDKETQIITWNSTGYFSGSINIPLLNPITAGKKISMYVDYLDGDLIINPDTSVTNRFLQIGSQLTGGGWLHVDNRTSISDLTYNVLSNDSASLGYLRFNCHNTKTVNLRMRILIAESDTKITYFTPAIIDKETYISDYGIIKPTEIIEK